MKARCRFMSVAMRSC